MDASLGQWPGMTPPSYLLIGIKPTPTVSLAEQIALYKEDQLLSHPGGDAMDLDAADPRKAEVNHEGFCERIGKDFRDAVANMGNFFKDLLWGSEFRYADDEGNVQTARRKGLLGNISEFFKDAVSGLSLGYFRPDGELEPNGLWPRIKFLYKKVVREALLDDLILGVPSSAVNMVDDAALGLWNLLEIIPDATIGNIPEGRKVVTSIFDNGQVMIDYLTDCLPTGEAWMRVHAYRLDKRGFQPPVVFNLRLPERFSQDLRWSTVRNTPFRKTIETMGSLLADVALVKLTSHAIRTSKRRD
jgi:hypothetical protein